MKFDYDSYGNQTDKLTLKFLKPRKGLTLTHAGKPKWYLRGGTPTWEYLPTAVAPKEFFYRLTFAVKVARNIRLGKKTRICTDLLVDARNSSVEDSYIDRWCIPVLQKVPSKYARIALPIHYRRAHKTLQLTT